MKPILAWTVGVAIYAALLQDINASCTNAPGLVSWWPGDGSANDIAGTNSGRMQGGARFATGLVGGAFSFDGVNSFVTLPNNFFPFPTSGVANQPFTFEVWFKTASGGVILGQQAGAAYSSVSGYTPGFYIGTDGKLRSEMFWSGVITSLVGGPTVTNGVFHHGAVCYDGTNSVLYLDGTAIASAPWTQTAYAAGYQYQFGTGYSLNAPAGNGGWFTFNGLVDEPSFYNRALNSNEVAAIYLAGSDGKCKGFLPSADLSLRLAASISGANLDEVFVYSITASNAGPNIATNLVITDWLPTNVSFISASAPAGTHSYTTNSSTATFAIPTLAIHSEITVNITVQAGAAGTATNQATAYADLSDPIYPIMLPPTC